MPTSVTLPALGESVTEGTITRWLKQVGDRVEVDEPLLEVSTDKVDTEIPSPVAGVLLAIQAAEDETVEIGAELAVIGESTDAVAQPVAEPTAPTVAPTVAPTPPPAAPAPQPVAPAPAAPVVEVPPTPQSPSAVGAGTVVTLPALGESVTEGTITRWLKNVGDDVAIDEAIVEVSTDKVDTEIPSPVAGTLLERKAEEDETIEVGAQIAVIGSASSAPATPQAPAAPAVPEPTAPPVTAPEPVAAPAPVSPPTPPAAPVAIPEPVTPPTPTVAETTTGGGYVTPLVRKMAAEHGVDLDSIAGTGVGGRIRKQDVLAAAEAARQAAAPATAATAAATPPPGVPSPLRGRTEKMSRLRSVIAKRMVESLQVAAQLTTVVEVDVTAISRIRDAAKADFLAREGVKLSFMPFFAKAATDALKAHPSLNAAIDTEKGEITYFDHENLSIAVDTEKGLLTPVIKNAGDLSISGLAKKIADLAERTRSNKIGPDELAGGTFTLTNTGSRGALFDTPIINQPQVAILGTGSVVKRAVVIDDPSIGETIAVRQMVYLALTYDHRLVDGANAARFLTDVKARLEAAQFEL